MRSRSVFWFWSFHYLWKKSIAVALKTSLVRLWSTQERKVQVIGTPLWLTWVARRGLRGPAVLVVVDAGQDPASDHQDHHHSQEHHCGGSQSHALALALRAAISQGTALSALCTARLAPTECRVESLSPSPSAAPAALSPDAATTRLSRFTSSFTNLGRVAHKNLSFAHRVHAKDFIGYSIV